MTNSVGVGTGGAVSVASGSTDASVGETEGVRGGSVATGGPGGGEADAGRAGRTVDVNRAGTVRGAAGRAVDPLGRAGALPSPPAPPGSASADDRVAGVASCQPTVTATGSPSATSPIKIDLGDNRT